MKTPTTIHEAKKRIAEKERQIQELNERQARKHDPIAWFIFLVISALVPLPSVGAYHLRNEPLETFEWSWIVFLAGVCTCTAIRAAWDVFKSATGR